MRKFSINAFALFYIQLYKIQISLTVRICLWIIESVHHKKKKMLFEILQNWKALFHRSVECVLHIWIRAIKFNSQVALHVWQTNSARVGIVYAKSSQNRPVLDWCQNSSTIPGTHSITSILYHIFFGSFNFQIYITQNILLMSMVHFTCFFFSFSFFAAKMDTFKIVYWILSGSSLHISAYDYNFFLFHFASILHDPYAILTGPKWCHESKRWSCVRLCFKFQPKTTFHVYKISTFEYFNNQYIYIFLWSKRIFESSGKFKSMAGDCEQFQWIRNLYVSSMADALPETEIHYTHTQERGELFVVRKR